VFWNPQLLEQITACGFVAVSCLVKANGHQHFVEASLVLKFLPCAKLTRGFPEEFGICCIILAPVCVCVGRRRPREGPCRNVGVLSCVSRFEDPNEDD
jgi:hypothetical protein